MSEEQAAELAEGSENTEVVENELVENDQTVVQDEDETPEGEEKPQSRSQNAKQRLRRKLGEAEARNTQMAKDLNDQKDRFDALESKLDGVINPPAERPNRVNFETEEDYEDALFDYRQPQVKSEKPASPPVQPQQPVGNTQASKNWSEQLDNGEDKYDDFIKVIENPKARVTDFMAQVIMESDVGSEVAYFLGRNEDEALRISELSSVGQIREIDKLSDKFKNSTSSAPTPIDPPKGGVDKTIVDLDKLSPDEYRKERQRQKLARQ